MANNVPVTLAALATVTLIRLALIVQPLDLIAPPNLPSHPTTKPPTKKGGFSPNADSCVTALGERP